MDALNKANLPYICHYSMYNVLCDSLHARLLRTGSRYKFCVTVLPVPLLGAAPASKPTLNGIDFGQPLLESPNQEFLSVEDVSDGPYAERLSRNLEVVQSPLDDAGILTAGILSETFPQCRLSFALGRPPKDEVSARGGTRSLPPHQGRRISSVRSQVVFFAESARGPRAIECHIGQPTSLTHRRRNANPPPYFNSRQKRGRTTHNGVGRGSSARNINVGHSGHWEPKSRIFPLSIPVD